MVNLNSLLSSLNIKADWVGLRSVHEQVTARSARNGILEPLEVDNDFGVMVEVLIDGQFAYAGTCDVSGEGVSLALTGCPAPERRP